MHFIKLPHKIHGSETTQRWIKCYILIIQAEAFRWQFNIQTHSTHKLQGSEKGVNIRTYMCNPTCTHFVIYFLNNLVLINHLKFRFLRQIKG